MTIALASVAAMMAMTQTVAHPPAQDRPVAAPADAPSRDALALASLLVTEAMVAGPQAQRQGREMLADLVRTHPELSRLEREAPGLAKRISDAVIPISIRSAIVRLPVLQERIARFYDAHLSPPETARIRAFYGSPTGQRFLERMMSEVDLSDTARSMAAADDFVPDASAIVGDLGRSGAAVAASMSADDQAVLAEFASSGLLPRLSSMSTQTAQLMLSWSTEMAAGEEAETQRAVEAAVKAHIAESAP